MNSIYFIKIKVVMSEHHLRYGCKNVVNIVWNWFLDYPKFHFQIQHLYTRNILRLWWQLVDSVTGMLKLLQNGAPLPLYYLGSGSILIGGHYNILEYSQTMITQIGVGLVDGFKEYLDRQFSSGSCALNVYTLSKVYLSVTNCKLTIRIFAKNLCFTQTQRREVNK